MSARVLLAILVIANVLTAIAVVFARHEHRQLFIALTGLERARDELNIEFGRLQLEQATWAESNRIDQVARERLGM
ncbi:MAG TPA: cell division protein FtsL, partial [Luteimonas sp.]|nr:cell division protein FtsL [Luteimonas sp.]